MSRGKREESQALKDLVVGFNNLSPEEQTFFGNKIFAKVCSGLTPEQRAEFKKERQAILDRICKAKEVLAQLETVSTIPTETLKEILAERTKAKK